MALEDFVDPEVGIAVAVTALATSPQARSVVRRGMVYGLAGLFKLGDAVSSAAQGVAGGAQQVVASAGETAQGVTAEARTESRPRRGKAATTGDGAGE